MSRWTAEGDELLTKLVNQCTVSKDHIGIFWDTVSIAFNKSSITKRSSKSCQLRYTNYVVGNSQPTSQAEDAMLLKLYETHKRRWYEIARLLKTQRTPYWVRIRYKILTSRKWKRETETPSRKRQRETETSSRKRKKEMKLALPKAVSNPETLEGPPGTGVRLDFSSLGEYNGGEIDYSIDVSAITTPPFD
jgi:hypothetical protein